MIVTHESFLSQIAEREGLDIGFLRRIFKSAESLLFEYLSSVLPSEEVTVKLFNGISVKRTYLPKQAYTKGMFQNISCQERVKAKASLSKYYNGQVNAALFEKQWR